MGTADPDVHPAQAGAAELGDLREDLLFGRNRTLPDGAAKGSDPAGVAHHAHQRRNLDWCDDGQSQQAVVVRPVRADIVRRDAQRITGCGFREARQRLGADPVVPAVQPDGGGFGVQAHDDERRPLKASMTLRRSSFPSAARPSRAPTAMKRREIRKPHKPNCSDMNATKAPIAVPTTVRLTGPPPSQLLPPAPPASPAVLYIRR